MVVIAVSLAACGSADERAAARLAQAQELFADGDLVKAKLEARNAAQIQPKNAQARYLLALIAEQERDYRQMAGHLMAAVDADPDLVDARVRLGTLYFLSKIYEQAAEQSTAALALAPDNPDALVLNAQVLIQQEKVAAANSQIEAALENDPDHVSALALHALTSTPTESAQAITKLDAAIERLEPEDAKTLRRVKIELLQRAKRIGDIEAEIQALIADFPDEQAFQFQLGQFYAEQGRQNEAEQAFRDVVSLNPEDADVRLWLVQFIGQGRDQQAAEEALKGFVEESPNLGRLRLALGNLYEATGRREEALVEYRQLAEEQPDTESGLAARRRIAVSYILDQDIDQARVLLEAILTVDAGNEEALLIRAGANFIEEQFSDAIADLRLVLKKYPEEQRAMLFLARSYLKNQEPMLAADTYRRLLAINPDHADGTREMVALAIAIEELDGIETLLRTRLEKNPDDITASSRLIGVLAAQDDFDAAEKVARDLMESEDESGIGAFGLGRLLQAQKQYEDAAAAYRQVLERYPQSAAALEGLMLSLVADDNAVEAIAYLTAHQQKYPAQIEAEYLLAVAYVKAGDFDRARPLLETVITERPEFAGAYRSLASTYRDDVEKRMTALRRGLDANPGDATMALLLGTLYTEAGRFDDAIDLYEETISINSGNEIVINNLSAMLLDHRIDMDSYRRALELAEPFADSTNPALLDTLGWACYRTGNIGRGIRFLERAVSLADNVPEFRYHLGMAYAAENNITDARRQLTQAVNGGDFTWTDEARAELELMN